MAHAMQQVIIAEKKNGAPEEIRTPDPQIRSLVLYPAELRVRTGRLSVGVWRSSKAGRSGMQAPISKKSHFPFHATRHVRSGAGAPVVESHWPVGDFDAEHGPGARFFHKGDRSAMSEHEFPGDGETEARST